MIGFFLRSSRDDGKRGLHHEGNVSLSGMEWFNGKLVLVAEGKNTGRHGGVDTEHDGKTSFSLSLELDDETLSNLLIAIAKKKEGGKVRWSTPRKPKA